MYGGRVRGLVHELVVLYVKRVRGFRELGYLQPLPGL